VVDPIPRSPGFNISLRMLPVFMLELKEYIVVFGNGIFCVGAHTFIFLMKIIGSHEAFVLIFIGLGLAYIHVLADGPSKLFLKELMLSYQNIKPIVFRSFLVLFLLDIKLVFPEELIGVFLKRDDFLFECVIWVIESPFIIDTLEHCLMLFFNSLQESIINFDKLMHRPKIL
jgi:hypothetical protein